MSDVDDAVQQPLSTDSVTPDSTPVVTPAAGETASQDNTPAPACHKKVKVKYE